ncbi:MAG: class D sortase, partial [Alphaproteobacteria bacterium]
PRLNVDRIVLAGGSGRTLAFGPGHVDGSAPPGGAGVSVIAGHRDTHFRFLKDLVPGDRIEIEAPNGNRTSYRVAGATIADARYQTLDPADARPRLALVTCYPFDAVWPGGPMRYVVFAEAQAEAQPARMMAASGIERPGIGALGLVTAGIAAPGVTAP